MDEREAVGSDAHNRAGSGKEMGSGEIGGFRTTWRGYDRAEVDAYVLESDAQLLAFAVEVDELRARNDELTAEVNRYYGLEDELSGAIRLSRQMNDRVLEEADCAGAARVAAAEFEARQLLGEARERIAQETAEMEQYRLAIAAEAATLSQIEQRLGHRISRAAAALVDLVDAPGGLGPFSQASSRVVEFARLLHAAIDRGALGDVRIELVDGIATATLSTEPAQAKAANSSSMALS